MIQETDNKLNEKPLEKSEPVKTQIKKDQGNPDKEN